LFFLSPFPFARTALGVFRGICVQPVFFPFSVSLLRSTPQIGSPDSFSPAWKTVPIRSKSRYFNLTTLSPFLPSPQPPFPPPTGWGLPPSHLIFFNTSCGALEPGLENVFGYGLCPRLGAVFEAPPVAVLGSPEDCFFADFQLPARCFSSRREHLILDCQGPLPPGFVFLDHTFPSSAYPPLPEKIVLLPPAKLPTAHLVALAGSLPLKWTLPIFFKQLGGAAPKGVLRGSPPPHPPRPPL